MKSHPPAHPADPELAAHVARPLPAFLLAILVAAVCVASAPAAQQGRSTGSGTSQGKASTPPRTPWGHPDVQGRWTNGMSGVPFERPPQFGTRELLDDEEFAKRQKEGEIGARDEGPRRGVGAGPEHWYEWWVRSSRRTSMIVDPPDGKLPPLTAKGETMPTIAGSFGTGPYNGPEAFTAWDRCITRGLPGAMVPTAYNNTYHILQTPNHVAIKYEMLNTRIIPLDGRPHIGSDIRQWEGDARGRWDGNTLVIEVTNFSDKTKGTLPPNAGSGSPAVSKRAFTGTGAATRLVERFTRIDAETMRYEATVTDPTIYTKPWTLAIDLRKDDGYRMFEYACHEGNHAIRNSLSGSRAQERDGR